MAGFCSVISTRMGDVPLWQGRTMAERKAFLGIVLHAHLPWVVNHGTWPHGLDWLHEAAAETYLPLLSMLRRLQADGIRPGWSLDLSPVLLEQLAHPVFREKFPEYVMRKIAFAQEDEAAFEHEGDRTAAELARFWQQWYGETLQHFNALAGDLVCEFRELGKAGMLSLMTCSATHGYNPLLGTDESVRAQVRLAVLSHRRHLGEMPQGIWLPECGYRPAGYWQPPVEGEGGRNFPGFFRVGVESALLESGLRFFVVDGHLLGGGGGGAGSPMGEFNSGSLMGGSGGDGASATGLAGVDFYHAYRVRMGGAEDAAARVAVFPRDPQTGFQVWSGDAGYPADGVYLDFHKKRSPGGLRYWRVTGRGVDLGDKQAYDPVAAQMRAGEHGRHFVSLVADALHGAPEPAMLCSPFDAELFGHWWFEGIAFLEAVARAVVESEAAVQAVSCAEYLRRFPPRVAVAMPEGSWGEGGDDRVWLNEATRWTWARLYTAQHVLRDLCTAGEWRDGAIGERMMKQMCRELLLMESSDWQFLITTGAARDYAERRFREHAGMFDDLRAMWPEFQHGGGLTDEMESRLIAIESTDDLFPEVNPEFWVLGARADKL